MKLMNFPDTNNIHLIVHRQHVHSFSSCDQFYLYATKNCSPESSTNGIMFWMSLTLRVNIQYQIHVSDLDFNSAIMNSINDFA